MNALRVYYQTLQNACSLHSLYKINHFSVAGVWRIHIMGGKKAHQSPCGALHHHDRGQPAVQQLPGPSRKQGRERTVAVNYSY